MPYPPRRYSQWTKPPKVCDWRYQRHMCKRDRGHGGQHRCRDCGITWYPTPGYAAITGESWRPPYGHLRWRRGPTCQEADDDTST